jgi:hypothetical protein
MPYVSGFLRVRDTGSGGYPDNTIWPPPGRPNRPDNSLPGQGGRPDNSLPSQKFWIVCGIPGMGWRYVCVDPSLSVGNALPPHAEPRK